MIDDLYREELLEHYREPWNFGKPAQFDISSKQINPLCGDDIEMFIAWSKKEIRNIGFIGTGCAICIASTSLLTEYAKGKTVDQLTKFSEEDMLGLLGIQVSETRKKCALLGWYVLKDCLS